MLCCLNTRERGCAVLSGILICVIKPRTREESHRCPVGHTWSHLVTNVFVDGEWKALSQEQVQRGTGHLPFQKVTWRAAGREPGFPLGFLNSSSSDVLTTDGWQLHWKLGARGSSLLQLHFSMSFYGHISGSPFSWPHLPPRCGWLLHLSYCSMGLLCKVSVQFWCPESLPVPRTSGSEWAMPCNGRGVWCNSDMQGSWMGYSLANKTEVGR